MARIALLFLLLSGGTVLAADGEPQSSFSPRQATPYFASGPAAVVRAHFALEEFAAAADGFAAYAKSHNHAADVRQAEFLAAYAAWRAGRNEAAAAGFAAVQQKYPLLAEYATLWGGRAELAAGHAAQALARASLLSEDSPLWPEALLLAADADTALGAGADAVAPLKTYVAHFSSSWRISEVRFQLAERLRALDRAAEATPLYRRVWLDVPQLPLAGRAQPFLGAAPFSVAELFDRAMVLFDQMRNADSEKAFAELAARVDLTAALSCRARYYRAQSVFKARDRWRAAPLFDDAAAACERAHDDDLRGKSLYQAGRSWGNHAEKDPVAATNAVARFTRLWKELPKHSYADDAQLRAAEIYDTIKSPAPATTLLQGLPTAFPDGDQRGEALWRLAFRDWLLGDVTGASKWLTTELSLLPREEGWWEAGRTLYWLGRVAQKQGDATQASLYFSRAAREYPLSYYALLALTRLGASGQSLLTELVGVTTEKDEDWTFTPRALFGTPGFRRGLELARLGLTSEAKRELSATGLVATAKKSDALDADAEERLWLTAVLYDRAGDWALSHDIPRRLLSEWTRSYPAGANRKRWLLAYPRGFDGLIRTQAQKNGVPPSLEMAIVREESAFDPRMESFANAIGLTQLTAAPAERFAQGLPHDGKALRDPVTNVTIGARELAHCLTAEGHPALAIAAYNAGEAAVRRWRRDPTRAALEVDELIESIPYDETRGYTKRVLSSYFTYFWLAATGPTFAQRIPLFPLIFAETP